MDLKRLSIGEMAKMNHFSEQTLRLYHREGLLKPSTVDVETGYRYYHINQSARLDTIQYMKDCGMTLKQIKGYLDKEDMAPIKASLQLRYHDIDHDIAALLRTKKAVERTLQNFHRYETSPKEGQVFMEYMPERTIYKYVSDQNFFDQDYAGYEFMLRNLKGHLLAQDLPISYFCNVGTIMRKEALLSGEYFANEIFVFVDRAYMPPEGTESIPAATYMAICCDDFYKEREYAARLMKEIAGKGFAITGDYICEVIAEFNVFDDNQRGMFYKIQVPVRQE